jgi:hypothetical protein
VRSPSREIAAHNQRNAHSAAEALEKARKSPVHEVYVHSSWLEKERNFNFFDSPTLAVGFSKKVRKKLSA